MGRQNTLSMEPGELMADNRKLQHALAVARSREADLEERLKRASQVMSGLIVK